jgi:hypothetical protein
MDKRTLTACMLAMVLSVPGGGAVVEANIGAPAPQLWRYPADIASRDLFYGPGGRKHAPRGEFVFVKEDRSGSSPKFSIEDRDGVKWKVKLGPEAQPETVASRLAWSVGYFTDQDYFVQEIRVLEMPAKLNRGQELVAPGGRVRNARLERHISGVEKLGNWRWRDNPFSGTREFNGLRVIMALLNNWDLKDVNNAIYADKKKGRETYAVADLGASFGTPGFDFPASRSRNNLKTYSESKFITKVTPEYVDFSAPAMPAPIRIFDPPDFIKRIRLRSIGKRIPRADARWIGDLLARLSRRQIADAFRAAGYTPGEVDTFTAIVQRRIAELKAL